ncbi:beta-lactamase/transpeptidase-like protein [Trichophaea hybrida]|nr:beta-lactamase/transpeptidase-like protein [Trichophaea hybrida]
MSWPQAAEYSMIQTNKQPIWEYHHTTPGSIVGNLTVDRHSQYRIGSVSKVFADLLLLRLGLDLGAPVTKWLPGLREGSGGVDWDDITLKDLGSHMAGIRRNYGFWVENYTAMPEFELAGFPHARPEEYPLCEVVGLREEMCTEELEKVTGMSYTSAVQRYITHPLGMNRTSFLPARTNLVIPSIAGLWHADLGQSNPAGGVFSSAYDLSRLARSILSPSSRLLSPAIRRAWLKPLSSGSSINTAVGFPWEITRTTELSRNGVIELYTKDGAIPGYGSLFSLVPAYGVGVVVLAAGDLGMYALADALLATVVPALEDVAREEAIEVGYTGRFTAGNGSWVEVGMDQGPGLLISEVRIHGVNILKTAAARGMEMRAYPGELTSVGKGGLEQEVWWLSVERKITNRPLGRGIVLRGGCGIMPALTAGWYAGNQLEKVVFVKTAGKVVGLEIPARRMTLMKV